MQIEKEIKSNNKPKWLTKSLKNLKTNRNKALRKWKSNPNNPDYLANFKIMRINFENAYKKSKNLTMPISLRLALLIQDKLIIYLMKSVAEVCTQ